MRLHKEFEGTVQGFDLFKRFAWVLAVLQLVSGCFSLSVVPFTRRNPGERYLGWINLFFAYTVVANFAFIGNLINAGFGSGWSWLMVLCWVTFVVASLYHRREIARKNRAGEEWHSMYMGDSNIPLPVSQETMYKAIEPGLVFLAGAVLFYFSGAVGAWLMISGICLLVNNHVVYFQQRQIVLDIRDRRIEARFMSDAVAGKPASKTAGFVLAESNLRMIRKDPELKQALLENLSEESKSLLDAPPEDLNKAA